MGVSRCCVSRPSSTRHAIRISRDHSRIQNVCAVDTNQRHRLDVSVLRYCFSKLRCTAAGSASTFCADWSVRYPAGTSQLRDTWRVSSTRETAVRCRKDLCTGRIIANLMKTGIQGRSLSRTRYLSSTDRGAASQAACGQCIRNLGRVSRRWLYCVRRYVTQKHHRPLIWTLTCGYGADIPQQAVQ